MNSTCAFSLLGTVALAAQLSAADNGDFYLKQGDRVVFYGDSITDQRLYTTFAETFVVTRFPKMNVTFVHSGWGGDRVSGGGGGGIDVRLKRDVLAFKPTVMTIMLGMNDASYRAFDANIFSQYTNGYQHIVDTMKKEIPNLRLTLIQPSPFDDVTRPANFEGGYNAVLLRYGQYIKELAEREHANVADLNTAVVDAVTKANAKNHDLALKINPDRVHPGAAGHLLMAGQLLKSWNAPAVVSVVEIDGSSHKVSHTEHAKVEGLSGAGTLTWTQVDEALPMPVDMKDQVVALTVNSSDFMDALDRQTLKVSGLSGANYTLKIDGELVKNFSPEDLGQGVNLALYPTPMAKQAQEVHRLTLQHNDIHFARWRQIQLKASEKLPSYKEALKELDKLEADVVKEQRKAAQPKPHKFELTPVEAK